MEIACTCTVLSSRRRATVVLPTPGCSQNGMGQLECQARWVGSVVARVGRAHAEVTDHSETTTDVEAHDRVLYRSSFGATLRSMSERSAKPGASHVPFAANSGRRYLQHIGSFVDRKAAEVPQLHNLGLPLVLLNEVF